ncbi:MAG: hypothetical protein PWP52_359 [Bacteroidales bacterium]|nr:hypothetical protein [Bacteroidales bacterium]
MRIGFYGDNDEFRSTVQRLKTITTELQDEINNFDKTINKYKDKIPTNSLEEWKCKKEEFNGNTDNLIRASARILNLVDDFFICGDE